MKKHLLYFFLLLCFACSCKKLPKETHKGKDMMACYVNGEKWVAKDRDLGGGFMTGTTIHSPSVIITSYFTIFGDGKKKGQGDINIRLFNFSGIGEYELNYCDGTLSNCGGYGLASWGFATDSANTGKVIINYYEEGKIFAGTFYFTGINNTGEKVEITDGRFDIGTFDIH